MLHLFTKLTSYLFLVVVLTLSSYSTLKAQTLTSDLPDYPPGSLATFFGTGFAPNETVTLHVEHVNMMADDSASYDSTEYVPWTVIADSMGDFTTTWIVCSCDGDTLTAIANGTFGSYANVVFTDAAQYLSSITLTSDTSFNIIQGGSATFSYSFSTIATAVAQNGSSIQFNVSPSITNWNGSGQNGINNVGKTFNPVSFTDCVASSTYTGSVTLQTTQIAAGTYTFNIRVERNGSDGIVTMALCTLNICAPPVISAQPVSVTNCVGNASQLSVTATGATSYQWRKGGINVPGATSNSLTISSTQAGDAGSYDVVVTNSCTSITSSAATITVSTATRPIVTQQPVDVAVCNGATVVFSVSASATGSALTYQWYKVAANGSGSLIGGATAATLTINNASNGDQTDYYVIISNLCGTVNSDSASLSILGGNQTYSITSQPANSSACEGGSLTLSVSTNLGGLSYQWRKKRGHYSMRHRYYLYNQSRCP